MRGEEGKARREAGMRSRRKRRMTRRRRKTGKGTERGEEKGNMEEMSGALRGRN